MKHFIEYQVWWIFQPFNSFRDTFTTIISGEKGRGSKLDSMDESINHRWSNIPQYYGIHIYRYLGVVFLPMSMRPSPPDSLPPLTKCYFYPKSTYKATDTIENVLPAKCPSLLIRRSGVFCVPPGTGCEPVSVVVTCKPSNKEQETNVVLEFPDGCRTFGF